jgi:acetyltransferase-like isoleucine patch superfamily enzyme
MVEEARTMGGKFINIIHPTVTLSKWAKLGEGVIIQRFSGINSDVVVGNFFVANAFASIGHDVVIGNYVHVNPYGSIAGGSKIGDDVFIGVKATVLTCTVGDGAVIGSCALVTKDVPPNTMAKGIPARFSPIEEKKY